MTPKQVQVQIAELVSDYAVIHYVDNENDSDGKQTEILKQKYQEDFDKLWDLSVEMGIKLLPHRNLNMLMEIFKPTVEKIEKENP